MRRWNIRALLADPQKRRALMIGAIIAIQAREGIETTAEHAGRAYDKARGFTEPPVR
jgi:hypothetical protein